MEAYITSHIGIIILILIWNSSKPLYNLYEYSGARAIKQLIRPPSKKEIEGDNYRSPSTFVLWIVSIYVAIFGLASNRYERAVSTYEMQIASWQNQIATEYRAQACANLKYLQEVTVPKQPSLIQFWNTFLSFLNNEKYQVGQDMLRQTIEAYKANLKNAKLLSTDLSKINFKNANLAKANLSYSDLQSAELTNATMNGSICQKTLFYNATLKYTKINNINFWRANFTQATFFKTQITNSKIIQTDSQNAKFWYSNFTGSNLWESDLSGAELFYSDFSATDLSYTELKHANFQNATLNDADMRYTNLSGAKNLKETQLSKAKTLYGAKNIPADIEYKLKLNHPQLFVKPKNQPWLN